MSVGQGAQGRFKGVLPVRALSRGYRGKLCRLLPASDFKRVWRERKAAEGWKYHKAEESRQIEKTKKIIKSKNFFAI